MSICPGLKQIALGRALGILLLIKGRCPPKTKIMFKYTGDKRDRELLTRVKKQISEKDYLVLIQWHQALSWHNRQAEIEITDTELKIEKLRHGK